MQVTQSNTLQIIIRDSDNGKYYKYFYVNGDFYLDAEYFK